MEVLERQSNLPKVTQMVSALIRVSELEPGTPDSLTL